MRDGQSARGHIPALILHPGWVAGSAGARIRARPLGAVGAILTVAPALAHPGGKGSDVTDLTGAGAKCLGEHRAQSAEHSKLQPAAVQLRHKGTRTIDK